MLLVTSSVDENADFAMESTLSPGLLSARSVGRNVRHFNHSVFSLFITFSHKILGFLLAELTLTDQRVHVFLYFPSYAKF